MHRSEIELVDDLDSAASNTTLFRATTLRMLSSLLLVASLCVTAVAVPPGETLPVRQTHPLYHPSLPPGAIWQSPAATQPRPVHFQPVAFFGPQGTKFSMPQFDGFSEEDPRLMAGLMVGPVYRYRITGIPNAPGAELYPTVELIGRTYAPAELATSYPIPITLSASDLQAALDGSLVTRVVYLEDPTTATPLAKELDDSRPLDLTPQQDALATADSLGRPIAIIRLGSMAPPRNMELNGQFYYGYPAWAPIFQDETPSVVAP